MIDQRIANENEIQLLKEKLEKLKYSNQNRKDQIKKMDRIAFGEHNSTVYKTKTILNEDNQNDKIKDNDKNLRKDKLNNTMKSIKPKKKKRDLNNGDNK